MKKTVKLLSLILAVVMLFSIVPFASAKDGGTISKVSLNYNFKNGDLINFLGKSSYPFTVTSKILDGTTGQPYADDDRVYADKNETYSLEVTLDAKDGYSFDSSVTKVSFNSVPITYKDSIEVKENEFRTHGMNEGRIILLVTFRYLAVDTDLSYSTAIENHVRNNCGFYIKNEIVDLDALPYDNTYHFTKWKVMQSSSTIDDDTFNTTQLHMSNEKCFVYAYYNSHQFDPVVIDPTETSLGYIKNQCEDHCGYYFLTDFKAPTGKPSGLKCVARTAAAEKLTWNKVNGATGYQAQMLTSAGKNGGLVTTKSTSAVISKLAAGHAYKARV